ncbi:Hypothetical predicted protein [Olea europaea subsp. europaea]|uniref:Uncharacterized protein n=1 Tax=Olea europaea subsp. europaea TaxID=158383 RepID=A0A8S0PRS0_OLEEU|nr:Hypothetical predicted protein [Olea europaea subsp. europaea]
MELKSIGVSLSIQSPFWVAILVYLGRSYIFVLTIELNVRVAPDGGEKKWKCANRTSFKHHVSKLPFSVTILDYWQIVMG